MFGVSRVVRSFKANSILAPRRCLSNLAKKCTLRANFFINDLNTSDNKIRLAKIQLEISPISHENKLDSSDMASAINVVGQIIEDFTKNSCSLSLPFYQDSNIFMTELTKDQTKF
jgi:hypothetical protein